MESEQNFLRLSVQRALLGEISANLAAVTAGLNGTEIRIVGTFFDTPSDQDQEQVERVATEVIADFSPAHVVKTEIRVLAQGRPSILNFWAFVRAGVPVG
jgi:hypothetical protein